VHWSQSLRFCASAVLTVSAVELTIGVIYIRATWVQHPTHTMEFTLTKNSPRNTSLSGPGVVYTVSTPTFGRSTVVARNGVPVAEIEYHTVGNTILRMGGRSIVMDDFLQKSGILGG